MPGLSRLVLEGFRHTVKWTNVKECNLMLVWGHIKVSYPNYNMVGKALNPFPTLLSILNPRARRSLDGT